MVRSVGFIQAIRRLGRGLLPKSSLRTLANSLLLLVERQKGSEYIIANTRFRFAPGSQPDVADGQGTVAQMDALQLEMFASAVRPGHVVADVGAWRGVYATVAAARAGDGGHVLAFEPVEANLVYLRKNLKFNNLTSRVTVVPKALAARAGASLFYAAGASSTNSFFHSAVGMEPNLRVVTTRVTTSTLDAEFEDFGRMPDLVKIDVEGAEFEVLKGGERVVRSTALIFCELHPHAWREAGYTGDELRAWVRERGREIVPLDSDRPVGEWAYGPVRLIRTS